MENLNEKQLLFGPFYCFCASKLDFLFFPLFSSRVADSFERTSTVSFCHSFNHLLVEDTTGYSGWYDLNFKSQTDRHESSVKIKCCIVDHNSKIVSTDNQIESNSDLKIDTPSAY